MKLIKVILAAVLLTAFNFSASAGALGDLAAKHGLEWIIGSWVDKDTNGSVVKLEYEWRLDKNAIAVKSHSPENDSEGIIALRPGTEEVGEIVVDSKGGAGMGKWLEHDGRATLKLKYKSAVGEEKELAIGIEKIDQNTIQIYIHKVEGGEIGEGKALIQLVRAKK